MKGVCARGFNTELLWQYPISLHSVNLGFFIVLMDTLTFKISFSP